MSGRSACENESESDHTTVLVHLHDYPMVGRGYKARVPSVCQTLYPVLNWVI